MLPIAHTEDWLYVFNSILPGWRGDCTYFFGMMLTVAPQSIWNLTGVPSMSISAYMPFFLWEVVLMISITSTDSVSETSELVSRSWTDLMLRLLLHQLAKWFIRRHSLQSLPYAGHSSLNILYIFPQNLHLITLSLVYCLCPFTLMHTSDGGVIATPFSLWLGILLPLPWISWLHWIVASSPRSRYVMSTAVADTVFSH